MNNLYSKKCLEQLRKRAMCIEVSTYKNLSTKLTNLDTLLDGDFMPSGFPSFKRGVPVLDN